MIVAAPATHRIKTRHVFQLQSDLVIEVSIVYFAMPEYTNCVFIPHHSFHLSWNNNSVNQFLMCKISHFFIHCQFLSLRFILGFTIYMILIYKQLRVLLKEFEELVMKNLLELDSNLDLFLVLDYWSRSSIINSYYSLN